MTSDGDVRRERLRAAHLYLVIEALPDVVERALAGGVDVVQLRDKELDDEELHDAALELRGLCEAAGALFIVNDRPEIALQAGADGVHVGQDDVPCPEARRTVGPDLLVGLSTHTPVQVYEARSEPVDYIGVGPIYETATKPGRPAVGHDLIGYADAHGQKPFFAIGGIDRTNVAEVARAGASRIAVVRAIRDADDPAAAAAELRGAVLEPWRQAGAA
ncbi:MAG TPA: thiamine phosphate synthase [Thermoleophilaceae bacterium]